MGAIKSAPDVFVREVGRVAGAAGVGTAGAVTHTEGYKSLENVNWEVTSNAQQVVETVMVKSQLNQGQVNSTAATLVIGGHCGVVKGLLN